MKVKYKKLFCSTCDKKVRAEKEIRYGAKHAIATILTCGLWLPVWLVIDIKQRSKPYECPICGTQLK